jgi:hypothetical protein
VLAKSIKFLSIDLYPTRKIHKKPQRFYTTECITECKLQNKLHRLCIERTENWRKNCLNILTKIMWKLRLLLITE